MGKTKWTPAQQAAIEDRGGALLLSAAAGSGKTAVLTERAVGLILDPEHPVEADRLLIVTFTNAAAAELRARIGNRLTEEVKKDRDNARLRRQRLLLQRASICTVDAFCMDLLHKHFAQLDIPAEFQPADAGQAQELWEAAMGETMEEMVQLPAFCDFADLYGRGRSDAAACQAIGQLYSFLQVLPDPDQCLEVYLESWRRPHGFARSEGFGQTLEAVRQRCEALAEKLTQALDCSREDMAAGMEEARMTKKTAAAQEKAAQKAMDKYIWVQEDLEAGAAFYEKAAEKAAALDWDGLAGMLAPYREEGVVRPGERSTRKRLYGDNKDTVKLAGDLASEACEDLLDWVPATLAEIESDRQTALPMLEALAAAQRSFAKKYYEKKLERKILDFSDMEQLALRLLRTPADIRDAAGNILPAEKAMVAMQNPGDCRTPLCRQIAQSFDAVMVDEYQDTNALQDAIYNCLAAPGGDNLFFVGDLKQSIYRFRQAEPHIFLQRQLSYPPLEGPARPCAPLGQGSPASIALDANFRSAPAVIDGINFIFTQIMRQDLGDVVYGDGQRLVCGTSDPYPGKMEADVLAAPSAEAEAAWVADRIYRLVQEEKALVRCPGGTRPIQYEDCCILVSTRNNFPAYVKALQDRLIPSYAATAEDLLDAPQVRPLIALLRVIDNPARNIELAAAMRSELFGFTDDDLLRLRAANRRCSMYGALVLTVQQGEGPFADKCRDFYRRLDVLRGLSRSMPVDRLLEEIFIRTGYLAAVGADTEGTRKREEVRRFAAWAAEAGTSGLGGLLRVIESTQKARGLTAGASGKGKQGCVSLMTIHGSKGLQFPAVFVVDTAHRFNTDDIKTPMLLHRSHGIGLALRGEGGLYPTVQKTQIRRLLESEMRSEQMRLLYVALTRAQDMLFVTLPLTSPDKAVEKAALRLCAGVGEEYLHHASCFADWLMAALLQHPDAGVLRVPSEVLGTEAAAAVQLQPALSPMTVCLEEAGEPEPAAAGTGSEEPTLPPDAKKVAAILQEFDWQYDGAQEVNIPVKVSVTGLVHQRDEIILERPGFMSAAGLTAAEMGTALHAFLEHADFALLRQALADGPEALARAIDSERQRQLSASLMAPDTAKALDLGRVQTFAEGEAFRRICAADRVYREYDFITGVPASRLPDGPQDSDAVVMVQGIADILLEFSDHLEILDYKTDRTRDEEALRTAYAAQLQLYAEAITRRFPNKPVTYKALYSFALGRLVEV